MKVLLFAVNGDVAGNGVPSARSQRGAPLASRTICTFSGIWNGLTFRRGYGSAMFARRRHVLVEEERRRELQVALVAGAGPLVVDAPAAAHHDLRRERRLPGEADARRDVVADRRLIVESYFASWIWLRSIGVPGSTRGRSPAA